MSNSLRWLRVLTKHSGPYGHIAALYFLVAVLAYVSLFRGAYHISFDTGSRILLSKVFSVRQSWLEADETVLLQVRLPRIILVILVSSALSVSGTVLQAVFRNPLVDPFLLGISSGASFGAALVVVLFSTLSAAAIQLAAFVFGITAVFLANLIASLCLRRDTTQVVLAGVVISALFSALAGLLKYVADPEQLQAIVIWTLGSFASAKWEHVVQMAPTTLLGCTLLLFLGWRINVISLGDQQSLALGLNPRRFKMLLVLVVSLMTSISVSVCGPIGWIGLIIPHLVRSFVGANNLHVMLGSIGLGSAFVLFVDLIARSVLPVEIPIGILTSVVGAAFFVFLMVKERKMSW
jgi:iron complex transport system permease protein